MGHLEDHYHQKAAKAARVVPPYHEAYNALVEMWRELRRLMLAGVNRKPPENCEWIRLDGELLACWQLSVDRDYTTFLYFVSDGRTVGTGERMSKPRVRDVREVSRAATPDELRKSGRESIGGLRAMCEAALSSGGNLNRAVWDHPKYREWREMVKNMYFDIGDYEDIHRRK